MVVMKWAPRTEEEKHEEEATPMWIHLHRVPLHMYYWEDLSFITSAIGFPDKPHPETLACSHFEVAKVFAEVNVSKPLQKEITFSKNGKEFTVGFYYPWLPSKCKLCDKWGHSEGVCVLKEKSTANLPLPAVDKEVERVLDKVIEGVLDTHLQESMIEEDIIQRMIPLKATCEAPLEKVEVQLQVEKVDNEVMRSWVTLTGL